VAPSSQLAVLNTGRIKQQTNAFAGVRLAIFAILSEGTEILFGSRQRIAKIASLTRAHGKVTK
jgi:hypothetical protein